MDNFISNQPGGEGVSGSFHYPLPDQCMPQQHLDLDPDPRYTTFQTVERDSYHAIDNNSNLSVSEEMSGYADVPVDSSIYESDEVYNSPYTMSDNNSISPEDYFKSGLFMERRPVGTVPGCPAQSHIDQRTSSLDNAFDRIIPNSTGNEPWVPSGIELKGSTGTPAFRERPFAVQYYSHDNLAVGHPQGRENILETESSATLSMNSNSMVDSEDIVLPEVPQYHQAHGHEQWTYPSPQYPYGTSVYSQHGYFEYSPTSNDGVHMRTWSPIDGSSIAYRSQQSAPRGFVGRPEHTTDQNVTRLIGNAPTSVQSTLVDNPGPSFTTMEKQNWIGSSPELFTNFGQQASGYVVSRAEQMRMTDPPGVAAQSTRFDVRVQTSTPGPQREPEDRQRKKHRQHRPSDTLKQILPRQRRSGAAIATSGRQSGGFQKLDSKMQPMGEGRTRILSVEGREHAKKMRREGACDDCKRKKCRCTHRLEEDLSSQALSRSSSAPTWQTPSTPGSTI